MITINHNCQYNNKNQYDIQVSFQYLLNNNPQKIFCQQGAVDETLF